MKTSHKSILEEAISNAIDKIAELGDDHGGYIYGELQVHMANAAEAVWDASIAGQAFAKEQ